MYLPRVFIEKYRTQRIPTNNICHIRRTDGYSTLAAPKMNMSSTWNLKIRKNAVTDMTHITYLVLRDTKQNVVTDMTIVIYLVLVLRSTNKTQSLI
jgi:hypothetical protein